MKSGNRGTAGVMGIALVMFLFLKAYLWKSECGALKQGADGVGGRKLLDRLQMLIVRECVRTQSQSPWPLHLR